MSNQRASSNGGVRNLRAMFEQKDDSTTSPPDRGRSPAGSLGGGSNGTSPRPLSKVRTSFVAVERSGQSGGQLGLRKENSNDPSLAKRRTSFSIDEESNPAAIADRKQSINTELDARKKSILIKETVPESAIADTPPIETAKHTSFMNGKDLKGEIPAATTSNSDKKVTTGEIIVGSTDNGKVSSSAKPTSKPPPKKAAPKPSPISTSKGPTTSISNSSAVKSPAVPKTPKTPTTPAKAPITPGKVANTGSSKAPEHKSPERKTSRPVVNSTATKNNARATTASSAVTNITKKANPVPTTTGFVKPRPRSPTKPARLPASLTAPTASSKSKVTASSTPPSRHSLAPANAGNRLHKTVSRSPSRASLAAPKTELRRTKSSIHSDRPALGRPSAAPQRDQPSRQSLPKQTASTDDGFLARMMRPTTSSASKVAEAPQSAPKHVAPADEGFLARMMRPTTSSSSKVAEKQSTPPRERSKSTTRPHTRDSIGSHRAHEGLRGSPSTRKLPAASNVAKSEAPKIASMIPDKVAGGVDAAVNAASHAIASKSINDETKAPAHPAPIAEEEVPIKSASPIREVAAPATVEEPAVIRDTSKADPDVVVELSLPSSLPTTENLLTPAETSSIVLDDVSVSHSSVQDSQSNSANDRKPQDTRTEKMSPSETATSPTNSTVETAETPKSETSKDHLKDEVLQTKDNTTVEKIEPPTSEANEVDLKDEALEIKEEAPSATAT